jgi:hypothetical protein
MPKENKKIYILFEGEGMILLIKKFIVRAIDHPIYFYYYF